MQISAFFTGRTHTSDARKSDLVLHCLRNCWVRIQCGLYLGFGQAALVPNGATLAVYLPGTHVVDRHLALGPTAVVAAKTAGGIIQNQKE